VPSQFQISSTVNRDIPRDVRSGGRWSRLSVQRTNAVCHRVATPPGLAGTREIPLYAT